ncbi:phosphotransferase family protein [Modestobacter italicus]|uniref:phosphotransferase family protein n=1 Tax=Modestobacter italicus (strain DSM 44449 / CECT 9708 / BC 501) TaxID=2732864 RepID=UPI001C95CA93|nr:aminoglycoside phosphotransferase family protein [Modestobacter italicus]
MKRPLSPVETADVVREALGPEAVVRGARELTEGTFNSAYALTLADGRELVLKVAPPPGTPLLTYERHLLSTEADCLRAFAERTSAPLPELVAAGVSAQGREYLLTSLLPGASWSSQAERIDGRQRATLRRQVGRHVAAMHSVTGDGPFGYPGRAELSAPTWTGAYQQVVDALLADAARYAVDLPRPAAEIGERLHAAADASLGAVTTPVLVHFDLWDGNVFVDLDRPQPVVTGLIDHERALWADPAADFVSLALLGDIAGDRDFLAGYADGGGPVVLDEATRHRLHLYRAHLALVMVVEAVPRGTAVAGNAAWNARVADWLVRELDALARR